MGDDIFLPPLGQHLTRHQPLVEGGTGLVEITGNIGHRGVDKGVSGSEIEEEGRCSRWRVVDRIGDHTAKISQLTNESFVLGGITAPGNLLLERHPPQTVAGGDLVARVEERTGGALIHLDLAFDDRNPRALESVVDGEDGSLDRNLAVIGGDKQLPTALVGRADDDVAPGEIDSRTAP